ncbi:MAG: glycogen/starch synthase [Vicinamibacterales bacterium]
MAKRLPFRSPAAARPAGNASTQPARSSPRTPRAAPRPVSLGILMIASEVAPFSKTGGLADVAAALPRALGRAGHDVTVMTPRYRGIAAGQWMGEVSATVAGTTFTAGLYEDALGPGARVVRGLPAAVRPRRAVQRRRRRLPGQPAQVRLPGDRGARVAADSAPARSMSSTATTGRPGSPAPTCASTSRGTTAWRACRWCSPCTTWPTRASPTRAGWPRLGLGWDLFTVDGLEFWDRISFLKAGVNFSEAVTTVSPTYAEEIQRPEYGFGFDGVMRGRTAALTGILNGIDVDQWNPEADACLPVPRWPQGHGGEGRCQARGARGIRPARRPRALGRPLVGMVSRLVDQKGFDLVAQVADQLAHLGRASSCSAAGDRRTRTCGAPWRGGTPTPSACTWGSTSGWPTWSRPGPTSS